MTKGDIYIVRFSAWAPGIANAGEWNEWALGRKDISYDAKGPEISFTDSLFRRRLSQISKMTIKVIHDILPLGDDTKIFFLSFRGELSRQYQINMMLLEEKALSPAAFSLSVFNAPAALSSMALGLKGGYSALYPGKNSFASGIKAAQAALLSETQDELLFVYADENIPSEYLRITEKCPPLAFALLLSRTPRGSCVPLLLFGENENPHDFLKQLILHGEANVSF